MYNILIALGAAVVAYAAGAWAAGWVAGFIPALIALFAAWFFLARRTGKQVEALVKEAMTALQAGRVDEARTRLEAALPLGKWQILVAEQIHGQLGSLDYMQAVGLVMQRQAGPARIRFEAARAHLEKSWSRDWRARSLLAVVHHREGRGEDAARVMEAASGPGKSEPVFWGLYAYVLNEAKKRDEALQVVGRGLAANADNKPLKAIQEALTNKKRPDMKVFGEAWYQFFPEEIPQEKLMQMQGVQQKIKSQKTWPQPRR